MEKTENTTDQKSKMPINLVLKRLQQRVSYFDARLILESAIVSSGIPSDVESLSAEEAKSLCLEMIKRGGPAFQVGSALYKEFLH